MAEFDELVSVLKHLLLEKFAPKPNFIRGVLGDGLGNVLITDRDDYNLVRFNRSSTETFEIFNKEVPAVDGWPVLIGEFPWQPGLTQVVGTDWSAYEQSGWGDTVAGSNPHAPTHEWPDGSPGADPLSVYMRAVVPLRAYSAGSGSSTVFVNSYEFDYQETGTIWPGVPGVDLSPVMSATATGTARLVGVYLDPGANALGVVTGTTTVHTAAFDPSLVAFPPGMIPSARVKIYGGQAGIGDVDIRDARRPFVPGITGSAAGGGAPSGPAGGDLTGSYPNPIVKGLQAQPVSSAAPAEGDMLMFSGTAWIPLPSVVNVAPRPGKVNIGATEYDTLAAADAAAVAGDVIWIGEGTYTGGIASPTDGVHLIGMGVDATILDGDVIAIDGGTIQDLTINRDENTGSAEGIFQANSTSNPVYMRNVKITGTNSGAGTMTGIASLGATLFLAGGVDVDVDGVALNVITGSVAGGVGNRLDGDTADTSVTAATLTLYGTILVNNTPGAGTSGIYFDNSGNLVSLDGLFDLNGIADGLVLDADGDTTISAPTDDQIDFEVGGTDIMVLGGSLGQLYLTQDDVAGGISTLRTVQNHTTEPHWSIWSGNQDTVIFRLDNTAGVPVLDWRHSESAFRLNQALIINRTTVPNVEKFAITGNSYFQKDSVNVVRLNKYVNNNTTNSNGCSFSFEGTTTGAGGASDIAFVLMEAKFEEHDHATSAGSFSVFTRGGTNLRKRFLIDSAGDVQITQAPATPAAQLDVYQNVTTGNQVCILARQGDSAHPAIKAVTEEAITNSVIIVATLGHNSTGTPAAGFGSALDFELESDTTEDQTAMRLYTLWATPTHASRKARGVWSIWDTAEREGIRIEADGTQALLGFYGGAAVSKPTALTGALTQITHTGPSTPDYAIATPVDSGAGSAWGFSTQDEFETAMSVILNLQTRVDELETKIQSLGLIA